MSLKNLFKHKLPIQFSNYIGNTPVGNVVGEDGCDFAYVFKSDRIHDVKKLSISKPLDIYEKLEPFLMYLISKIRYEVQFPYRITRSLCKHFYYNYFDNYVSGNREMVAFLPFVETHSYFDNYVSGNREMVSLLPGSSLLLFFSKQVCKHISFSATWFAPLRSFVFGYPRLSDIQIFFLL